MTLSSSILFLVPFTNIILFLLSRWITPRWIWPEYAKLSTDDKKNWDSRHGTNAYALFIMACICRLAISEHDHVEEQKEEICTEATLFFRSAFTRLIIEVTLMYFLSDLFLCWTTAGKAVVLHHIVCVIGSLCSLYTGHGQLFIIKYLLIFEGTSLFVNLRWWLHKMNKQQSRLYLINGLSLFLSWIAFRMIPSMYTFRVLFMDREKHVGLHPAVYGLLHALPVCLFSLNTYWFALICRGVYRALFVSKRM